MKAVTQAQGLRTGAGSLASLGERLNIRVVFYGLLMGAIAYLTLGPPVGIQLLTTKIFFATHTTTQMPLSTA